MTDATRKALADELDHWPFRNGNSLTESESAELLARAAAALRSPSAMPAVEQAYASKEGYVGERIMQNSSWETGFNSDLAKAASAFAARAPAMDARPIADELQDWKDSSEEYRKEMLLAARALEQIKIVCADNSATTVRHDLALEFVAGIAQRTLASLAGLEGQSAAAALTPSPATDGQWQGMGDLMRVNRLLNKIANLIDDEDTCDPLDDAIKWANEALTILGALPAPPISLRDVDGKGDGK